MKTKLFLASAAFFAASLLSYGQSSGPNTPAIGSSVPDGLTFSLARNTSAQLAGGNSLGPVDLTSYNDFSDQVLVAVYHASW